MNREMIVGAAMLALGVTLLYDGAGKVGLR